MDRNSNNYIFKILCRNIDFIVKTLTIFGSIFAMISVILYLRSDIKNEIRERLKDKDVVDAIVKEIKPLFIIFNDKGKVIFNNGCEDYIEFDSIGIKIENGQSKIVIKTKVYLKSAPIVTSLDSDMYFYTANQVSTYQWEFPTLGPSWMIFSDDTDPPPARFKLEIYR